MDTDQLLESYFTDIRRIARLTPEEEVELARRVRAGDESARQEMIAANLRFGVKIAREYRGYGLPLPDLIEEANLGIMKAVDRFDPERGFRFATYAAWWIRQSVGRSISQTHPPVRLPSYMVQLVRRYQKARADLAARLGHEPTLEELGSRLDLPEEKVREVARAARVREEAFRAAGTDAIANLSLTLRDESPTPAEIVIRNAVNSDLMEVLGELDERQQLIIRERFGFDSGSPKTLRQIGTQLGLTRERVRQILRQTLAALQGRLSARHGRELARSA